MEVRVGTFDPADRVLLVDDWIETGAQMMATAELVEDAGATVDGIAAIGAGRHEQTAPLYDRYPVGSIG